MTDTAELVQRLRESNRGRMAIRKRDALQSLLIEESADALEREKRRADEVNDMYKMWRGCSSKRDALQSRLDAIVAMARQQATEPDNGSARDWFMKAVSHRRLLHALILSGERKEGET